MSGVDEESVLLCLSIACNVIACVYIFLLGSRCDSLNVQLMCERMKRRESKPTWTWTTETTTKEDRDV